MVILDKQRAELEARARFRPSDVVHYHGKPCVVRARYWRQPNDSIVYDLREMAREPRDRHIHLRVREAECFEPSPHTLGFDPRTGQRYT